MFKKLLFIFVLLFSFSALADISPVGTINNFTGLEADTKPTNLIGAGSKFFETDTNHVYLYDGDSWQRYIDIDDRSGAVGSISQEHLKIHEGLLYTVSSTVTIANVGGVHDFMAVVPAGTFPHFRSITISTDNGPIAVQFFEDTTVSASGSLITAYNNSRSSLNVTTVLIYDSPTVTSAGVVLETIVIPGNKQTGSFGSESSNEWILKPSTNYIIRVTNNTIGAGDSEVTINMFFYEG